MLELDIDPKILRGAFGRFMTGVTVVTARAPSGELVGFTANSFTSVSLDPPLLLVCPGSHLSSYDAFCSVSHFAVSILAEGQEDISNTFAKSKSDRFAQTCWQEDTYGSALIDGRAAGFSCEVFQKVPAGDHTVLMGRVTRFDQSGRAPLGYCADGYFSLSKERQSDAAGPKAKDIQASVILQQGDDILLTAQGGLPTVTLKSAEGARTALRGYLDGMGVQGRLGPVYSIYDEGTQSRRIVILGTLVAGHNRADLRPCAIADLPMRLPQDPAMADMLCRFASEHQRQSFGLYVGDVHQGEIHTIETD